MTQSIGPPSLAQGTRIAVGFSTSISRFIPACGELSKPSWAIVQLDGSSPLTRGTHPSLNVNKSPARFIPAYAGNSTNLDSFSDWSTVHPRLRGELNTNNIVDPAQVGSSPLTRGTLTRFLISATTLPVHPRLRGELDDYETWKEGGKWFIPAYAGNSSPFNLYSSGPAVHPRLRGELSVNPS